MTSETPYPENPSTPSVGRIVHYVPQGSPMLADGTQEYPSDVCRAAVITEVAKDADGAVLDTAGLAVLNPTGMFFHPLSNGGSLMDSTGRKPGSWHWPERL